MLSDTKRWGYYSSTSMTYTTVKYIPGAIVSHAFFFAISFNGPVFEFSTVILWLCSFCKPAEDWDNRSMNSNMFRHISMADMAAFEETN